MREEHILELIDRDEDGSWDYGIEHPASCSSEETNFLGIVYTDYDCDVSRELHSGGLEYSFAELPSKPGRYRIKAWHSTYSSLDGVDYESGLEVLGCE